MMEAGNSSALEAFTTQASRYPDDPLAALHARRLAQGQSGTLIVLHEK